MQLTTAPVFADQFMNVLAAGVSATVAGLLVSQADQGRLQGRVHRTHTESVVVFEQIGKRQSAAMSEHIRQHLSRAFGDACIQ